MDRKMSMIVEVCFPKEDIMGLLLGEKRKKSSSFSLFPAPRAHAFVCMLEPAEYSNRGKFGSVSRGLCCATLCSRLGSASSVLDIETDAAGCRLECAIALAEPETISLLLAPFVDGFRRTSFAFENHSAS